MTDLDAKPSHRFHREVDDRTQFRGFRWDVRAGSSGIDEYRRRVQSAVTPFVHEIPQWEEDGHLPREVFRALGREGLFHDRWEHGERGGLATGVALVEELAPLAGGLSLAVSIHNEAFIGGLQRSREPDHVEILQQALAGDAIGCFACTEPTGGSDLSRVRTRAEEVPGGLRLQGEKRYITNAGRATHALVLARTDTKRPNALSILLVPLDAPGVEIVGYFPKLGTRSADATHLRFDTVLPQTAIVGAAGGGLALAMHFLQTERLVVSAQVLAGTRYSLRLANAFLRRRTQFESRLIDFQALRHRLAECWTDLAAAEATFGLVLERVIARQSASQETAALKLLCGRIGTRINDECIQFLGGRGYSMMYPAERMWRDARLARIGGGTDEILREMIGTMFDRPDSDMDTLLDLLDANDIGQP